MYLLVPEEVWPTPYPVLQLPSAYPYLLDSALPLPPVAAAVLLTPAKRSSFYFHIFHLIFIKTLLIE